MLMKIVLLILLIIFSTGLQSNYVVTKSGATYEFANGISPASMLGIKPLLQLIVDYTADFSKRNNATLVITSAVRSRAKNAAVGSVSQTHVEGRAVDFSIQPKWGWNSKLLSELLIEIEKQFGDIGAISLAGKVKTIMVIHDVGYGNHCHIQIRRGI